MALCFGMVIKSLSGDIAHCLKVSGKRAGNGGSFLQFLGRASQEDGFGM